MSFEVIVVDNGSFDGCREMLASEFPFVFFVQNAENLGFARANNLAAQHAKGEYLLFLNPDTEFVEDSISILREAIQSAPDSGAIGCKLLNSDRSLQTSCVQSFPTILNQLLDAEFLQRRFPRSRLWGAAALHTDGDGSVEVEAVSGACLFMKREVVERVGGFTESYFMYGEDLDLCFRLKQAGYAVCHTGKTSLIHYGGASSRQTAHHACDAVMRESVYRFLRLNHSFAGASRYRVAMLIASLARIPLIIVMLAFGRSRAGSLQKWLSILRWSVGLEHRFIANACLANDKETAKSPVLSVQS